MKYFEGGRKCGKTHIFKIINSINLIKTTKNNLIKMCDLDIFSSEELYHINQVIESINDKLSEIQEYVKEE